MDRIDVEVSKLGWFGLGKPRSKLGRWLDEHGLTHQELSRRSGVSEDTITRLSSDGTQRPSWRTEKRLLKAMRHYDSEVSAVEFWE